MTCLDCVNCINDYNGEPYCSMFGHLDDEDLKYEHSENCFEFEPKEMPYALCGAENVST